jgi:hypothetical protein
MLCDRLVHAKWLPKAWVEDHNPEVDEGERFIQEIERLKADEMSDGQKREELMRLGVTRENMNTKLKAINEYIKLCDTLDGNQAFCLLQGSLAEVEYRPLKDSIANAQKFVLSEHFADATLAKLATPDTIAKAIEWFRLTHDLMWMEWRHATIKDGYFGILLDGIRKTDGAVFASLVTGSGGQCIISSGTFYPETLRYAEGEMTLKTEGVFAEIPDLAVLVTDFVIRINSPRITDVRDGDDTSALNRKRIKQGKQPLFSYRLVDLNKQVKAGLRAVVKAENGPAGQKRLHWRRGHFKCCRTGIFWWNPHLAGRDDLGYVDKEYAA